MKAFLALLLVSAAGGLLGCADDSNKPKVVPEATFVAEGASPAAQLVADYENHRNASFHVEYRVDVSEGFFEEGEPEAVVWSKDGTRIIRYDFRFDGFDYEDASVFIEGAKDRIVLCSDDMPADFTDEKAMGAKGACCEGRSSCGDLGGNLVYSLGFPLGVAPAEDDPEAAAELEAEWKIEASRRNIADVAARCYALTEFEPDEYENVADEAEICFSAQGEILFRHFSDDLTGEVELEAVHVGVPEASSFEYPYPVQLDPNEQ